MSTRLEMCCNCGNETGKAGRADDSIYVQSYGPLCEKCWDELRAEVIESSAPVESGTVSGEASPRVLAELREIESAVTHFDCECDALSDEDDTCALCRALAGIDSLRKALRAPPLSPVTPSAELIAAADELRKFGTCACGPEMLKRHPDCKGCQVATAYDEARAKVSSTAPATPSVTVEEAVAAYNRAYRERMERFTTCDVEVAPGIKGAAIDVNVCVRAGVKAVLALSLPRAPAKETSAVEAEVVERCVNFVCSYIENQAALVRRDEHDPWTICRNTAAQAVRDWFDPAKGAQSALARAQEGRGT